MPIVKPTRIVWMSQHPPTTRQVAALEAIFPHHTLLPDHQSFDGADDIVARYHQAGGDEMVVVAPLTVMRELIRRGIHPLYAEMRQIPCHSKEVDVRTKRRCFKFVRFHRATGVRLELEDVITKKEE